MPRDRMSISWDDLKSESVEKKLQQQDAISQAREHYDSAQIAAAPTRKPRFTFIYNTVFYMGLFGALGGLLGWGFGILFNLRPNPQQEARTLIAAYEQIEQQRADKLAEVDMVERQAPDNKKADLESDKQNITTLAEKQLRGVKRDGRGNDFFDLYLRHHTGELDDKQYNAASADLAETDNWKTLIANVLFYGIAGMMIAACLGMAESVVERNMQGAIIQGSVGALVGLVGGIVVSFFDERIYKAIVSTQNPPDNLRLTLARAVQWGVLGLFLSLGPGVLLRNLKKLSIGLIAGLIGGIVGGLLFEPMKTFAERFVDNGEILSRLIGLLAIGIVAGVGTGLIENAVKSGWFKVTEGLIAGKQFVLYRNPTYIGSSPQCHIYLFKDPKVGRRHAAVHVQPGGFEIEDLPLGSKTMVNGKPIQRAKLRAGDRIQVGSTAFIFQEKAKQKD
ncbi:MAG TPA: FHA domain-containing protein [Tepidisphaeraceae bacterium]|nr:FHA domain-containing protein [Tepidisphaeraceae bacterium]